LSFCNHSRKKSIFTNGDITKPLAWGAGLYFRIFQADREAQFELKASQVEKTQGTPQSNLILLQAVQSILFKLTSFFGLYNCPQLRAVAATAAQILVCAALESSLRWTPAPKASRNGRACATVWVMLTAIGCW